MKIIELKTAAEFAPIYGLLIQTNPSLTKAEFKRRLKNMLAIGYRCIAMVENGHYLGICGFWEGTRFWCGDFIDVDNVIVDENVRGKNIGKKMIDWVEALAKKQGRVQLGLDCYVSFNEAHRFYFREGYIIKGYHFTKAIEK